MMSNKFFHSFFAFPFFGWTGVANYCCDSGSNGTDNRRSGHFARHRYSPDSDIREILDLARRRRAAQLGARNVRPMRRTGRKVV